MEKRNKVRMKEMNKDQNPKEVKVKGKKSYEETNEMKKIKMVKRPWLRGRK